jgi:hypothetical protein
MIFEHIVNDIKSVDAEIGDGKKIPILAPAASLPQNTEIIDYLLSKPISKYIDGISVHSYNKDEPSWAKFLAVMKKYGKEKLPIYVTEWNKTAEYNKGNEFLTTNSAISYTGKKLIQFLKYGIAGANYYSTTNFVPNSQSKYENIFGFYKRINNQSQLLPQGKTWQLLSQTLALGKGASQIYDTSQSDKMEAMGFVNLNTDSGLVISNESKNNVTTSITLQNINIHKHSTAKLYIASGSQDPKTSYCTQDVAADLSNPSFSINIPSQSVVGITFDPPKLSFNSLLRVLGISTSVECLIGL